MNRYYTNLLTVAALLVAGSASAQKNMAGDRLMANHAVGHYASAEGQRGGGPANDGCGSVTPEALAVGGALTFTGNNTGATMDGDYEAGSLLEGAGFPSVWHAFTTTECTNMTMAYCGSDAAFKLNFWIIISTNCPNGDAGLVFNSSRDTTSCPDGQATIRYNNLPAGTYYVPVLTDEAGGVVGNYTIAVTAEACIAAPANDDCVGAIPVAVGESCTLAFYTSESATETLPAEGCSGLAAGNANDDIWFSFIATATEMTVTAQGAGDENTGYDAVLQVYSGPCDALAAIDCEDSTLNAQPETVELTALIVGTTYFFRSFHWYATEPGDFNVGVCVTEGVGGGIGMGENGVSAFSLFPNPGTGVFTLGYAGENGVGNIEVFDLTGRVVYNEQAQLARGSNHTMQLGHLGAGNYNVRLTVNGERTEQRLMVK